MKHLNELVAAAQAGYQCCLFFIVQMKNVKFLAPNDATHPQFGDALRRAFDNGVNIMAYDCSITEDGMEIADKIPVNLGK